MKFECNPQELSDALTVVSKAISPKVTIPILEGIKILAEGDTLTLSATDMDMYVEKKIKSKIKLEGEIVVLGKFFTDFIRKMTSLDSIELEKTSDKLYIRYGENEGEIQCLTEDTYPGINQVDDDNYFNIEEGEFKKLIEGTIYCCATDDSRPVLKGCLLEITDDGFLTAVALDGYRIAICKAPVTEFKGHVRIIVNGKTLGEISKILTETNDMIKVNIQKNNIMLDLGHTRITTRLMEGEFLQYQKIIGKEVNTVVEVNKLILESGLERASLIARNQKSTFLKLSLSEKQIIIRSNGDVGSVRESLACSLTGKDMDVAFNGRYISEALNHVTEDYVKIELSDSTSPASINPLNGNAFKYIVLPVRMIG